MLDWGRNGRPLCLCEVSLRPKRELLKLIRLCWLGWKREDLELLLWSSLLVWFLRKIGECE